MKTLVITGIVFVLLLSSVFAISQEDDYWITQNKRDLESNSADKIDVLNNVWINNVYLTQGFHRIKITGAEDSCQPNQTIWGEYDLHIGDTGYTCINLKKINTNECGDYVITISGKNYSYSVRNPEIDNIDVPVVPEFGLIAGITTIALAIASFLFIRRK